MQLMSEWVEFPAGETTALAWWVRPEAAAVPLPAVVLVQEIWGVDEWIRDLAGRFAAAGYLAVAPDLYSLGGRRPPELEEDRIVRAKTFLDTIPPSSWWDDGARTQALAALPAAEGRELGATFGSLFAPRDFAALSAALRGAVTFLAADAASNGRVGAAGWCNGGTLVGRLACAEPRLEAAVVFYGATPDPADIGGVACPVAGFYGGLDPRVTGDVPAFADAMRAAGKRFEWHVYEGAPHAFFNDTRAAYTVDAARDAWARTLAFLSRHLGQASAEHGETGGAAG